MVLVDPREGSADLLPLLTQKGLPASIADPMLPFGDFSFDGNGPHGLVLIGIERKRISDLLTCMTDGRFEAFQLPGMLDQYDHSFLVVEGIVREGDGGGLEEYTWTRWKPVRIGERTYDWRSLRSYLLSLRILSPIEIIETGLPEDTATVVRDLYRWFEKPWQDHSTMKKFRRVPVSAGLITRPSQLRLVAKEFRGIGWELSAPIAERFKTVRRFAEVTQAELQELEGIGRKKAESVYRAINEYVVP